MHSSNVEYMYIERKTLQHYNIMIQIKQNDISTMGEAADIRMRLPFTHTGLPQFWV